MSRNHSALSVIRDVIFDGMPLATISVAVRRREQHHDMGTVAGGVIGYEKLQIVVGMPVRGRVL